MRGPFTSRAAAIALLASATVGSPAATTAQAPPAAEAAGDPREVRVMYFNIRYFNRRDGKNSWGFRRHTVTGCLQYHRPDIVGVGEALAGQMHDIAAALPGYGYFGDGRDGRAGGERELIYYDERRFERVRAATFWLSRTPDRPGRDWGARLNRTCTWGELRDRETGRSVFVFNTHLDHQSHESRVEGARLIARKIVELAHDQPAILIGDFNCAEFDAPYTLLTRGIEGADGRPDPTYALRDALHVADQPAYGPSGTLNGFDNTSRPCPRIDYILVKNAIAVRRHAILSDNQDGRTPSDHRPVVADLLLHVPDDQHVLQYPFQWRFRADPERGGLREGYHEIGFDDSEWGRLRIGETWDHQGVPGFDGFGWYRRSIPIPSSWQDRKILLTVNGVDDAFTLFVNGERIVARGSRSESWWDRTAVVHLPNHVFRYGQDNLFVFQVEDYTGFGGMNGYPLMLRTDDLHVTDVADAFRTKRALAARPFEITSDADRRQRFPLEVPAFDADQGWLRVIVRNGSDDSGDAGVVCRLLDANGDVVRERLATERGAAWFETRVAPSSDWTIEIDDADTELSGRFPGNDGSVSATVRYEPRPAPSATATRVPKRPRHVPETAVYWNKNWYWFSTERMTFDDAKARAAAMRGRLVTISSVDENDFVHSRLRGITFLGLERDGDAYRPVEGKRANFFLWDAGEPSRHRDERFVCMFHINGHWHDHLGHEQHYACVEWGRERK